jgi:ketosteroid isomerase-like protein
LQIGLQIGLQIEIADWDWRLQAGLRPDWKDTMKYAARSIFALVALLALGLMSARAQRVDQKTAAAAIIKADADFNQAVADRDLTRFLSFVGEPATFNGGLPEEIHGRDAVAKDWAPYFQANGPRVTWTPTEGEILGHGDLGYTVGTWERRARPGTQPPDSRGNYLTVWKKQADGAWRVAFDTGSSF